MHFQPTSSEWKREEVWVWKFGSKQKKKGNILFSFLFSLHCTKKINQVWFNCIHQQGFVVVVLFLHHVCFLLVLGCQEQLPTLRGWHPQMHARSPHSVCGWTTWLFHKSFLEQQNKPKEMTAWSQEVSLTHPLAAYWRKLHTILKFRSSGVFESY